MVSCPICGPKLSICCSIISVWGIIMLGLLGLFFRIHSPALFEDIPFNDDHWKERNYSMSYVHEKYEQVGLNCWIAAGIYVLFFIFSFVQHRWNASKSYEMR